MIVEERIVLRYIGTSHLAHYHKGDEIYMDTDSHSGGYPTPVSALRAKAFASVADAVKYAGRDLNVQFEVVRLSIGIEEIKVDIDFTQQQAVDFFQKNPALALQALELVKKEK